MNVSELTHHQQAIRSVIRSFLLDATEEELRKEKDISIARGDAFREECIREIQEENDRQGLSPKSRPMTVRRKFSQMIDVSLGNRRFIPAGMTGIVVAITDKDSVMIAWNYAFALTTPEDAEFAASQGVIRHYEEKSVPIAAVEWVSP